MASNVLHYVRFRGDDGMTILQRPDEISTLMAGERRARGDRPAAKVVYLLLKNNNRVEVVGETIASVIQKLEIATGISAVITGELPEILNPAKDPNDA